MADVDWPKLLDMGFAAFVAIYVIVRLEARLRAIEGFLAVLVDRAERDRKRRKREGDPDAFTPVTSIDAGNGSKG